MNIPSKDINNNLPKSRSKLKPLKALLINGPNIKITAEITELYKQAGALIIGDGQSEVNIDIIRERLKGEGYKVTKDTRIDIHAHGWRDQEDVQDFDNKDSRKIKHKQHAIELGVSTTNIMVNTKDFFQELREEFKRPLYVHIWSCYGGSANKAANYLGPGSIMISHVDSKNTSWSSLSNHALFSSVKNHLNNDLPLHKKIIDALAANTQTMTINLVKAPNAFDNEGKKFSHKFPDENGKKVNIEGPNELIFIKTARTLKPIELEKLINELEKNQPISQAVANFLQADIAEFKQRKDFYEITEFVSTRFGQKLQKEDLNDIARYIDEDAAKKYLLGSAIYLTSVSKKKNLKTILEFLEVIKDRGINLIDQTASNPLKIATYKNRIDIIDWFIDEKNNPDIAEESKSLALIYAARHGNKEITQSLLYRGADFNLKTPNKKTAHHIAKKRGYSEIVDLITKTQENRNELLKAVQNRDQSLIKDLIDKNTSVNIRDQDGLTPLIHAILNNDAETVKLLLNDKRTNINFKDQKGWTPLIFAVNKDSEEMVKLLLAHGADINIKRPDEHTALTIASPKIKLLLNSASENLNNEANVNKKSSIGNTKKIADHLLHAVNLVNARRMPDKFKKIIDEKIQSSNEVKKIVNSNTKPKKTEKNKPLRGPKLINNIEDIGRAIKNELAYISQAFSMGNTDHTSKKPQKKDSRHR